MIEKKEAAKEKIRNRYKGIDKGLLHVIPAMDDSESDEDSAPKGLKRVAVYARVSTGSVNQVSSFEMQKLHYGELVKKNPAWKLVEIYADEGISGTSLKHRDSFNRMITDARNGKFDIILTKSVSRFSRNVVDCIKTVRELAALPKPVEVHFEVEGIRSFDRSTEMMLSVLAAVAQEESHNKSIAIKTSMEYRYSHGIFSLRKMYGYHVDQYDNLWVNKSEADVVKMCFYLVILGHTALDIARIMTRYGFPSPSGNKEWSHRGVEYIVRNEKYCGDILAMKTYTESFLTHKVRLNNGERNQYYVKDHHEAIVDRKIYYNAKAISENLFRHNKELFIPRIQVINKGILSGFVPVNLYYRKFEMKDYEEGSLSVRGDKLEKVSVGDEKRIPLSRYEETRYLPTMSMHGKYITINTSCLESMPDEEFFEILINFKTKELIIRSANEKSEYKHKWLTPLDLNVRSNWNFGSKFFLDKLFEYMGWERDKRFYMLGKVYGAFGKRFILFDMKKAVSPESGKTPSCSRRDNPHKKTRFDGKYVAEDEIIAEPKSIAGKEWLTEEEVKDIEKETERIFAKWRGRLKGAKN